MPRTNPVPLPMVAREVPPRYQSFLRRAEAGNAKAAIALKCLECCAWDAKEVRQCHLEGCSLHHLRPYGTRKRKLPPASGHV